MKHEVEEAIEAIRLHAMWMAGRAHELTSDERTEEIVHNMNMGFTTVGRVIEKNPVTSAILTLMLFIAYQIIKIQHVPSVFIGILLAYCSISIAYSMYLDERLKLRCEEIGV